MRGRILLQDLLSHYYLAPKGTWTSNCQDARVFEHTYMALQEGLNLRDRPSQVVWCFRNPSSSMYLPVRSLDADKISPCASVFLSASNRKPRVPKRQL